MKAFMEVLVLFGGFLAFAAFGYYSISKLEDFLNQNQVDRDKEVELSFLYHF